MNGIASYAFALLVWPGLIGAMLLGWLYMWIARKLTARMQGRKGPPFYQPFWDFVKLLGKKTTVPSGVNRTLFHALPLASLAAVGLALVLVPIAGNPVESFPGDVVLLLYLLEVPVLCDVLAGYVSRSLYGQMSSMREALLTLGYNLPFLAAIIALAQNAHSFSLSALQAAPFGLVHIFAAIAFIMAIPARLKSNPFSIPNAEQEIVAGSHIEYNSVPLAFFELSHALELVLLSDLFLMLFVPQSFSPAVLVAVDALVSIALVALVSLLAATTARLKMKAAFRFYWTWGALAAAAAIVAAMIQIGA
jgi:NADH-quinone oxidoreductase subunit H